jgi:hypothetical protein
MNLDTNENYGQDDQGFQSDAQYKDDDSVSNVLDNSINDEEQDLYQENDFDEDYKDADDIDPDDMEEDDLDDDLDEDYTNQEEDLDEDEEVDLDEGLDQNRNI